jgi:hypothetical protein
LYTREYFEMCRAHLNSGGVTSMWLPIYSLDRSSLLRIIRAFHEVFPQTAIWYDVSTVNEFTVVTGMVEPGPVEVMWERAAAPAVAESLRIANVFGRENLVANLLLAPDDVARLTRDVPAFVDDLPSNRGPSSRPSPMALAIGTAPFPTAIAGCARFSIVCAPNWREQSERSVEVVLDHRGSGSRDRCRGGRCRHSAAATGSRSLCPPFVGMAGLQMPGPRPAAAVVPRPQCGFRVPGHPSIQPPRPAAHGEPGLAAWRRGPWASGSRHHGDVRDSGGVVAAGAAMESQMAGSRRRRGDREPSRPVFSLCTYRLVRIPGDTMRLVGSRSNGHRSSARSR